MNSKQVLTRRIPTEDEWFYYKLDDITWGYMISLATFNPNEKDENKKLYLSKEIMDSKMKYLQELLGCCRNTAFKRVGDWVDSKYIIEDENNYYFPRNESYLIVDKEIIEYLVETKSKFAIKVYAYLAWKDNYMRSEFNGRSYNFTIAELLKAFGYSGSRNSAAEKKIGFIFNDFESNGLISFHKQTFRVNGKTITKNVLTKIVTDKLPEGLKRNYC